MAVDAASLSSVTDATRFMLRFITVSRVVSKPSRIKSGWLGSEPYSSFSPATLDLPRISTSGILLGLDPESALSIILKDGSRVFRLWSTFCAPTLLSSSPLKVAEEPVKLSFLRRYTPVTTTSLILWASDFIMMRAKSAWLLPVNRIIVFL